MNSNARWAVIAAATAIVAASAGCSAAFLEAFQESEGFSQMGNPLTLRRWNRNPFQMWLLLFAVQVSLNQILFLDRSGLDDPSAKQAILSLAVCNLTGGAICMAGLHLRDKAMSRWVEMCGYIALIGSLGIYVYLVWSLSPGPITSYGLGLSEAFVIASCHRVAQMAREQWKIRRRRKELAKIQQARLQNALSALHEAKSQRQAVIESEDESDSRDH
jgi:hypothetical protein